MKKKTKTTVKPEQITAEEHFKLRITIPTGEDGDSAGEILAIYRDGGMRMINWSEFNKSRFIGWTTARYPKFMIPEPETPEAKMRREFEEWAEQFFNLDRLRKGTYANDSTQTAWNAWQAAKGGAQ